MKKCTLLVAAALIVATQAIAVPLNLLNDSVSVGGGGITATAAWGNPSTMLSWEISDQGAGIWSYKYTWNGPGKDLSHIIIEVTLDAPSEDFYDFDTFGTPIKADSPEIKLHDPGPGNPDMPNDIYGIKLDLDADTETFMFSFLSNHSPTWGDFYVKDGKEDPPILLGGAVSDAPAGDKVDVVGWNTGFSPDGVGAPNDGYHIAVPNGTTRVPEAGSTVLLLGFALIALRRVSRQLVR